MIKAIGIATSLLVVTSSPSLAQPDRDDSGLQTVISALRNCIRSDAEAAYLAGVQSDSQAAEFFLRRCNAVVQKALSGTEVTAVPPGRFRYVVYQEWAAFKAGLNNR